MTPIGSEDNWRQRKYNQALSYFNGQLQHTPNDERLWSELGLTQIILGQANDALVSLQKCIDLPWSDAETVLSCKYNMACAYAQLGQEEECRTLLEEVIHTSPRRASNLASDYDFAALRDKDWFQRLLPNGDEGVQTVVEHF